MRLDLGVLETSARRTETNRDERSTRRFRPFERAVGIIGAVWGLVRGAVAWLVGFLVTLGLAAAGVVGDGAGIVDEAAVVFAMAHAVPPVRSGVDPLALVVVPATFVGAGR
ncbi:hypothetical protein RBH26_03405 [Natronolimnohabitans sp. A-GB9]|uniref:hypothetical protein n=1 Tax=Natronolimnohabitans sp. A-GB9 TaxID=3069757 RepID=UPI0027B7FED2|nr:hypothetical protein [Natronolimnohabitans sp. A-GB9]MDQ2049523.1 hypothetical protein [Natronolimnohabitans sp. A-GB9]